MKLKPSEIFYSQDSINSTFTSGCHRGDLIGETLDKLLSGNLRVTDFPEISVTKKPCSNRWYSVDNRRLWMWHHLQSAGKVTYVSVKETSYSSHTKKFTSTNGGTSIQVRRKAGGKLWKRITPVMPVCNLPDPVVTKPPTVPVLSDDVGILIDEQQCHTQPEERTEKYSIIVAGFLNKGNTPVSPVCNLPDTVVIKPTVPAIDNDLIREERIDPLKKIQQIDTIQIVPFHQRKQPQVLNGHARQTGCFKRTAACHCLNATVAHFPKHLKRLKPVRRVHPYASRCSLYVKTNANSEVMVTPRHYRSRKRNFMELDFDYDTNSSEVTDDDISEIDEQSCHDQSEERVTNADTFESDFFKRIEQFSITAARFLDECNKPVIHTEYMKDVFSKGISKAKEKAL